MLLDVRLQWPLPSSHHSYRWGLIGTSGTRSAHPCSQQPAARLNRRLWQAINAFPIIRILKEAAAENHAPRPHLWTNEFLSRAVIQNLILLQEFC